MSLVIDTECDDYRFNKTLNEDVLLKPNEYNQWDIQFEEKDYVNVTGVDSLRNAICILIMTCYKELQNNQYSDFGCRIHELIKANKSSMVKYKVQLFVEEVLDKMRRIHTINFVDVEDSENFHYSISFNVTSINDEIVEGSVEI